MRSTWCHLCLDPFAVQNYRSWFSRYQPSIEPGEGEGGRGEGEGGRGEGEDAKIGCAGHSITCGGPCASLEAFLSLGEVCGGGGGEERGGKGKGREGERRVDKGMNDGDGPLLQSLVLSQGTQQLVPRRALQTVRPSWHSPWKLMRVISGHLGWVRCIAVDPSNDWFATGSNDRTIKVP